ncbi:uncharacterized protein, partial [Sinocyclocheilus grahami]|uniref:uncharacterized protein n=1 Tax=Sinocyclocheilus grahami TaxID=75366 RepID=UPI0007AD4E51
TSQINLSLSPPQNPSSLDWSIQSTLSSLFPPFEATAPTVLSQLFRTIEERYHGDALQCLLNFLIPAKHILESVQQAACAAYSDVLFRCEGWPLCLRDRVVIQLAPINPLLLRPGDFYLQVEPFGEQSARIVLKSLLVQEDLLGHENLVLQAGSRLLEGTAIEGTPIPETSYPCIFTESWLREINEGRHGNPLCQCVLSSDQGVVKVPWTEVANPEFLDRPKSNIWPETKPCSTPTLRVKDLKTEISKNESQVPIGLLPLDMETRILPANDGMAVSVQLVDGGSRLVKVDQGHPISSFAGKPVGWVSPNTWDSRHNRELEGEYVDLLEFSKEKETLVLNKIAMPTKPLGFKLVRTTKPAPKSNVNMCEEDCNPCMQNKPPESMQNDPESKCRYRQSYMAALRNPVNFERKSMLRSLDVTRTDVGEVEPSCEGYGVGLRLKPSSCTFGQTPNQADRNPMQSFENSVQQKQSPKNSSQSIPHDCSSRENAESSDQHMTQQLLSMVQARQQHKSFLTGQQDLHQTVLGTKALPNKRQHCLNNSFRQDSFQMRTSGQKHAKTQQLPKMGLRALPDHSGHRQDANLCLQGFNPIQLTQASKQTPPLFQPQFSQILFQNENRPLDFKVFCDDRHSGRGSGSPVQVIKGKNRSKSRSSSSVSETTKECLQSHKPTNRSRSDVYPEIIPMLPAIQGIKHTANLVSPKLNRRQEARKGLCCSQIQKWCDAEEQSWQKDKDDTEKTLLKIEQRLQDVQSVLIRAKEKKEKGTLLIKEVERKSKGIHYPETEAFGCKATTFKTSVTGFLLKAEERKSELETSVDLYRFCEEDKSSALLERHPDEIWMWNAVWAQCRDIRQRLTEILQASYSNQAPLGSPQKDSAAARLKGPTPSVITTSLGENEQTNPAGGRTETRNSLVGQGDNETVTHFHLHCEPVTRETSPSSNSDPIMTQNTQKELNLQQPKEEGRGQHFHQSRSKVFTSHNGPTMQLRTCLRIYSHSDSDLRKPGRVTEVNHSPHYTALVRSRSEGSCLPITNYHVSVCKTAVKHKVQMCAASGQESDSSRASWDGQSSKLSHQDSFCSSASGLSQSDVNEKFSSDTKSDEQSLISPATRSDLPVQMQDERMLDHSRSHILLIAPACLFADLHAEIRMQERVFMGIGHKPFMDIQPSEMAINDRAVNCSPTGRGGIPVLRLNSVGSASYTSSSGSHSSSSGWGSTSPVGHLISPSGGDVVRYVHGTSGILEEDDLDQ